MSGDVERVAEAICGATSSGKYFPWDTLHESDKDAWRAMAVAAIEALGLTEQWAIQLGAHTTHTMSENAAKSKAEMWPESFRAVSRVASPWMPA